MFYWLIPQYSLPYDAWTYHKSMIWWAAELAIILAFTSFSLCLIFASKGPGNWAARMILPIAFLAGLMWVDAGSALFVGLVQAVLFLAWVCIRNKVWNQFGIRDVMMLTLFSALMITCVLKLEVRWVFNWKVLLVGVTFGLFTGLADSVVRASRGWPKWVAGLVPYLTLLILILGIRESKWQAIRPLWLVIACLVALPVLGGFATLIHQPPIPKEYASGKNHIHELIQVGEQIGDWCDISTPPIPLVGTRIQQLPTTETALRSFYNLHAEAVANAKELIGKDSWMFVNYDFVYRTGFKDRCPQRNAVLPLNFLLLSEARIALLDHQTDDAVQSWQDAFGIQRLACNGGLPLDRVMSIRHDTDIVKEIYGNRDQLSDEHARTLIKSIVEQDRAYEPYADVWQRRLAWESRVPEWNQQLLLDYLRQTALFGPRSSDEWSDSLGSAIKRLMACELAIRAFEIRNLRLPESLEELVPEWLDEIPSDPFSPTSEPLIYKAESDTYRLYSLGKDEVDNGGKDEKPGSYTPSFDLTLESTFR